MGNDSIIDRTNRFYLENSRKFLSQREYDILHMLLLEKRPVNEVALHYMISTERIYQIYRATFDRVRGITEALKEMDYYRDLSNQLKQQAEELGVLNSARPAVTDKVAMPIFNSPFPFSKRMYNMLTFLEVGTIGELAAIPLKNLKNIKGFKVQCRKELIAFIEFECIQDLFEGYWKWKKH
jgi:hypothetical protein